MKRLYRATVFIKFELDDKKMKSIGMDIEMPASGVLHDDIWSALGGDESLVKVEGVVVKQCAPLPSPLELEVLQTLCEACNQLRETRETADGRLCNTCYGSVLPFRRKKKDESTHPSLNRPNS